MCQLTAVKILLGFT